MKIKKEHLRHRLHSRDDQLVENHRFKMVQVKYNSLMVDTVKIYLRTFLNIIRFLYVINRHNAHACTTVHHHGYNNIAVHSAFSLDRATIIQRPRRRWRRDITATPSWYTVVYGIPICMIVYR